MYTRADLEETIWVGQLDHDNTDCRVPGGRGLQQTARPLSRDETRSVNPYIQAN